MLRGSEQAPRGTFKPHDMMLHRLRPPATPHVALHRHPAAQPAAPLESFLPDDPQKFRRKGGRWSLPGTWKAKNLVVAKQEFVGIIHYLLFLFL
jgi:hypothetical protein